MDEYIKRETVINHLDACMDTIWRPEIVALKCFVEGIPAADVAPVVHGRWIDNGACGYKWAFSCSKCGYIDGYPFNDRHNYCPNCGARMAEDIDEQKK